MKTVRRLLAGLWDFVVGDDPWLALAALVAIGVTALACALGGNAWWVAPAVALLALWLTLRAARPSATRADNTNS